MVACSSPSSPPPPPPSEPPARASARPSCSALRCAQLGPGEIEPGVAYLSGELRQRRTGVGWAALRELPPPALAPELGVAEVDAAFARIAALERGRLAGGAARGGHGALRPRDRARAGVPARAGGRRPAPGRAGRRDGRRGRGRHRHPARGGATGRPMLCGDPRAVAEAALREGEAGLGALPARGRPAAQPDARVDRAPSLGEAHGEGGRGGRGLEARRRPHPGPPRRRRRGGVHRARSTT